MLQTHRREILSYENVYGELPIDDMAVTFDRARRGNQIVAAQADYAAATGIARPESLLISLNPAKNGLIADLQSTYSELAGLQAADYLSTAVFLGAPSTVNSLNATIFDRTGIEIVSKDIVVGGTSTDYLRGYGGTDQLFGGDGSDQLFGDEGVDELIGGEGNDQLAGGADDDVLDGEGVGPTLAAQDGVDADRLRTEVRLLHGQLAEYQTRKARLEAEIARRDAELRSAQEVAEKLAQTVPIARQQAEGFRQLFEEQGISKSVWLDREQQRIEQEQDLAAQRSRVQEIQAARLESVRQRAALTAETKRVALDSLQEGERKAAAAAQELVKARQRERLMRLTAPVEGTVQQVAVHTVGGVVTPAQVLMIVVPKDDPLEIEASIENKDIGFVRPGQPAEIKVETFPYTKYGTVPATVRQVSTDAVPDEKRGLVFTARLAPGRFTIEVNGASVNLTPGMAVTAEIQTDRRRVIEYFLSPLLQYATESFRER
jgi:HlyD family type I secretion membrane fusion protein